MFLWDRVLFVSKGPKKEGQRKSWTLFRGLVVLAFFAFLGGGAACGPVVGNITGPCSAELLKDAAYETASAYDDPALDFSQGTKRSPYTELFASGQSERGCLLIFAEAAAGQTPPSPDKIPAPQTFRIKLKPTGEIGLLNETTGNEEPTIRAKVTPGELGNLQLRFRTLLIQRTAFQVKEGPGLEAEHKTICDTIAKPTYDCFPKDLSKKEPCWFFLDFQPSITEQGLVKIAEQPNSCRLCVRELCGNKKDDDCDGQIDEGCAEDDCHHPGRSRPCYPKEFPAATKNQGICKEGTQICAEDAATKTLRWGACQGAVGPKDAEVCNGLDDNCNGQIDEGIASCCAVGQVETCYEGPEPQAGKGICKFGTKICTYQKDGSGAWGSCEGAGQAETEICDGKDNNCDGKIDEPENLNLKPCTTNLSGECSAGQEVCKNGKQTCQPANQPTAEVCDGKDNDCNGQIDEVFAQRGQRCTIPGRAMSPCERGIIERCENGKPVCTAVQDAEATERCDDGIDNDCNDKVDKDDPACACKPGETQPCYTGSAATKGKGLCKDGVQTCLISAKWGDCVGQVLPTAEICDGKDNNCNGQIDETYPELNQLCLIIGKNGPCTYGKFTACEATNPNDPNSPFLPKCTDSFTPSPAETCGNGIDDNCNGLVDEVPCTCTPDARQACYRGPTGTRNVGECKAGQQTCGINGTFGGCVGEILPTPEICDGKDNNCNGTIDEGNPGGGAACSSGEKGVCNAGTLQCIGGALTCKSTLQPGIEICDGKDNDCDGKTDEDEPSLGTPCTVPQKSGACAEGTVVCNQAKLTCQTSYQPKDEECNGKDDDCDGAIDNVKAPPLCPEQKGVCAGSAKLCAGSKGWLDCNASDYLRNSATYETNEVTCDGKDNDCDGKTDENLTRPCYSGAAGTEGKGACKGGEQRCISGQWSVCEKEVAPSPERCNNGLDDDCNGQVDDEALCGCWGTGVDGDLTVRTRLVLDQAARSPQQPVSSMAWFAVQAIDGEKLTLDKTEGLAAGDELLLLHLQGAPSRVGQYEFLRILRVDKQGVLALHEAIKKTYGSTDNTDLKGQTIRAIRVPHYKKVLIQQGGDLTVSPWDGERGGVLVMRVQEYVQVAKGGLISVEGKGYRGGPSVAGGKQTIGGESIEGRATDASGKQGAGSGPSDGDLGASGGGGGYATAGGEGLDKDGKAQGKGGAVVGEADLSQKIFLGSGGGTGAPNAAAPTASTSTAGQGGAGGGILILLTRTLNLAGVISAKGAPGGDALSAGALVGGGGGGSGGSLLLQTVQVALYEGGSLSALGGAGGKASPATLALKALGGAGGEGRSLARLNFLNGADRESKPDLSAFTPAPSLQAPLCK